MGEIERIRGAYAARARGQLDGRYGLFDPANLYLFQRRERALLDNVRRRGFLPLAGRRVLDVGCGSGEVLGDFVRYGADQELVAGIDLLPERVETARARLPSAAIAVGNAAALPFQAATFDIALQFTLMSSVLDRAMRHEIASETVRVLRPGGTLIWYDFIWNPGNRDVRGVGLAELRRLYASCAIEARRVTLAPPLSRRLARVSWTLCRLLEAMPLFRSHLIAIITKPAG